MSNIVTMPKRPTWTGTLTTMKLGLKNKIKADISEANNIRPLISGKIKDKFPKMKFETETITEMEEGTEKQYLQIIRIA